MLISAKLKGLCLVVSWFIYILDLLREGITAPSFIFVRYVGQILERGVFLQPPPPLSVSSPEKAHPEYG